MIGARVGIKTGGRVGGAVGIGADPLSSGAVVVPDPPAFQANGTPVAGSSASTPSPSWPTHQAGDIAILWLSMDGDTSATLSVAAGFAAISGADQEAASGTPHLQLWWCRATSSSMTAPTIADTPDDSQKYCGIITFRGCVASGDPFESVNGTSATTDAAVSIPGGTTLGANRLVVAICAHSIDAATPQSSGEANASLTSVTEVLDVDTTQGSGNGIVVITGIKAAAGVFGATTCTLAASSPQALVSLALKG